MSNWPYLDKPNIWSSHSLIVNRLSSIPAGTKVLDIGTATGVIGRMCQGLGLKFEGIELNPEWADKARPYYETIVVGTLETCTDQFLSRHEVVICGDVLEHMANPQLALGRLSNLQPNGCLFIISVPNIANIWIRLNLLFGRFDYTPRGILDCTHLRFFARKTLIQLIESAGLTIEKVNATPIPLELISPFFENNPLGHLIYRIMKVITDVFPTLFGYQFFVVARKGRI